MTGMTLLTDRARTHRLSRAEFEAWRDGVDDRFDHNRYELLDGEILVTPSPGYAHQKAVRRLMHLLEGVLPPELGMVSAPFSVVLDGAADGDTTLEPDLVVAPEAAFGEKNLSRAPLLVVEVLSPSTWRRDLGPKLHAYARAGVQHYWVVAPGVPSLTVHRLAPDGTYREAAHVEGEALARIAEPVALELRPADLVR